jgi:tRNA modification GTPase
MNLDDTIVAISSPPGAAPRGIVRLSGSAAFSIASALFTSADGEPCGTGILPVAGDTGETPEPRIWLRGRLALDGIELPAAVYVFRAPHSYTRQDIVEFHLLGAPGVLALLVESCLAAGARRAEPGEFTARAYLAGAFDLSQVHAIAGMIAARSDHQLQAAERLLHGALGRIAATARDDLADLIALVEAALDFADEPIEFIAPDVLRRRLGQALDALRSTAAAGLRAERWSRLPRVVLLGGPNVGKSSLLNRLTGLDRAICAPIAGTTRDVLSAPLALGDAECLLIDMAGIQNAASDLDRNVQAAARGAVDDADLLLHVVDASTPVQPGAPRPKVEGTGTEKSAILVLNKCDLLTREQCAAKTRQVGAAWAAPAALGDAVGNSPQSPAAPPVCLTSAKTGAGCEALKAKIAGALHERPVDIHDTAIALMAEHRDALQHAIDALDRALRLAADCRDGLSNAEFIAAELHAAAHALGTLVGEEQTEDTLGRIFARFCIGK